MEREYVCRNEKVYEVEREGGHRKCVGIRGVDFTVPIQFSSVQLLSRV